MGKVILQICTSLDGFVTDQKGELDWIFKSSNEETNKYVVDLLDLSEVILLGRGMAKEFLDYWPTHPDEIGQRINKLPKIIFSKTLSTVEWPDVTVVSANLTEVINKLKHQHNKNLILYGGANIVQTFMNLDLIDEYHLMVPPVILGKGLPLFKGLKSQLNLKLIHSQITALGVVILCYEPVRP